MLSTAPGPPCAVKKGCPIKDVYSAHPTLPPKTGSIADNVNFTEAGHWVNCTSHYSLLRTLIFTGVSPSLCSPVTHFTPQGPSPP